MQHSMFTVEIFDELPSTNDYLKKHHANYNHNSVIMALKQTKGRGRFERVWESTSDLTFSILFKQSYPQELIAPLAIMKALEHYGIDTVIKWPNDILFHEKKIAGILIEKVYEGNTTRCQVVGIGVNICEPPQHLKQKAYYVPLDANDLLHHILYAYEELIDMDNQSIFTLYQSKNYLKGRKILLNGVLWEADNVRVDGCLKVVHEHHIRYLKSEEITLEQVY